MQGTVCKYNPKRTLIAAVLLYFLLGSCFRKAAPETAAALPPANRILYLTLEAASDALSKEIRIRIIQQQVVNGTLKTTDRRTVQEGEISWKVSLLDANGREESTLWIPDPMILHAESADEDGRLYRKEVQLKETEIPLRLPYRSTVRKIRVERVLHANNQLLLEQDL